MGFSAKSSRRGRRITGRIVEQRIGGHAKFPLHQLEAPVTETRMQIAGTRQANLVAGILEAFIAGRRGRWTTGRMHGGNAHGTVLEDVDRGLAAAVEEGRVDGGGGPVSPVHALAQNGQSKGVGFLEMQHGATLRPVVPHRLDPIHARVVPVETLVDKVQGHGIRPSHLFRDDRLTCTKRPNLFVKKPRMELKKNRRELEKTRLELDFFQN